MALDKVNQIKQIKLVALPREPRPVAPATPAPALDWFVRGAQGIGAPVVSRLGSSLWSSGASGAGNQIVANAATSTMTSLQNHRAELVEQIQGMIQNVG